MRAHQASFKDVYPAQSSVVIHLMRSLIFFILTIFISLSNIVIADPLTAPDLTARQWLDKMTRSIKEGNYKGVLSYRRGEETRSLKIFHGVIDNQEYERLIDLEGSRFEIIKHGHDLSCVHVGESKLRIDERVASKHFSSLPKVDAVLDIDKCYELKLDKGHRVAGRSAVRITFLPKDEDRYQRVFMLDEQTGLLLQNVILNNKKKVLEEFKYLDLVFGQIPESELKFERHDQEHLHLVKHPNPDQQSVNATLQWQAAWLPKGFVKTATDLPLRKTGAHNLGVQMFSDGVTSFSIFIDKNIDQLTGTGRMQKGATAVVARAVTAPNVVVTVAGEIPVSTANKIAQSVSF